MTYLLYGAEISYFTGKARAYLRWKGVDFEERPSDREFYEQICVPRIGYPMIPLLITPDNIVIQDTTLIMDHFEALMGAERSFTAPGAVQRFVARLVELYADDWLLIPAMHYRWHYDADTTLAEFGMNLAPDAPAQIQREVGAQVGERFRSAPPMLGIHEHNTQHIEQSYKALLIDLDAHFRQHQYLFGDRPCTGDFALAGALYAHLYRDATAGALMRQTALAVARYVERMMMSPNAPLGECIGGDQIPQTLYPVVARMMREQLPFIAKINAALPLWKDANPDTKIPRAIGFADMDILGVRAQRAMQVYPMWLYARAHESYAQLDASQKAQADQLLASCEGGLFASQTVNAPVELVNYQLVWARE